VTTVGLDARSAGRHRGTGIGTYTHQLAVHLPVLDRRRAYVQFTAGPLPLTRTARIQQVDVRGPGGIREEDRRLGEAALRAGCDLVHLPTNGFGALALDRRHIVVTIHDLIPFIMPATCSPGYRRRFLDEVPRIVGRADAVCAVSQRTRQDLVRILGVPAAKVHVTLEAAEACYRPLSRPDSRRLTAARYGVPENYILYTGGFGPRKNLPCLLEAYARCVRRLPGVPHLCLAGDAGSGRAVLERLAARLGLEGLVVFPGFVDWEHMPGLYSGARLFVYPSLYEGFGLPPLEAMACGCPVIAGRTGSLPEVLGNGALLVDPEPDSLARAMLAVLARPPLSRSLAARGRRRARRYSWRKTASQTVAVYQRLLG